MKFFQFITTTVTLAMTACMALSYPTLAGYSGTGVLPTAATVPAGQVSVAADFYNTDDDTPVGIDGATATLDNTYPIRILVGATNGLEIGAGYSFLNLDDESANTWNVNVKGRIINSRDFPWALGARFAQTDVSAVDDTINTTNVYLVGTGIFSYCEGVTPEIRGSIGVNWTNRDSDVLDSANAFRVFGSAAVRFPNNLVLAADVQSKNDDFDDDMLYSAVVRYPFAYNIIGQVGYTNADPTAVSGSGQGNFFAGLNVCLDECFHKRTPECPEPTPEYEPGTGF